MQAAEAQAEASDLSESMHGHKRAIRRHRKALQADGEKLARLQEVCLRIGIALVTETPSVEGESHGSVGTQHRRTQGTRHH